jgi:hypothetical protein
MCLKLYKIISYQSMRSELHHVGWEASQLVHEEGSSTDRRQLIN